MNKGQEKFFLTAQPFAVHTHLVLTEDSRQNSQFLQIFFFIGLNYICDFFVTNIISFIIGIIV